MSAKSRARSAARKPAAKPAARKVLMHNPNTGRPDRNIDGQRYDAVRKAILKVVPREGEGIAFADLPAAVRKQLPNGEIPGGGAINWYTTVVKLHMESRGELRRVPGAKPQRLVRG